MHYVSKIWSRLEASEIPLHPIFATCVTVLLLLTGGVGSVYSPEIKAAFPFQQGWPEDFGGVSKPAAVFWAMAVTTGLLFYYRQRAEDQQILARAERLEMLIRTLPPENFLEKFELLFVSADKATEQGLDARRRRDQEGLDKAFQTILRIVATLAQFFDGQHSKTKYAANIMLFRESTDIPATERPNVVERLKFREDGVHLDGLQGVLDLPLALSATTAEEESHDLSLQPIALPVPQIPFSASGKLKVLPGAPLALVSNEPSGFSDTSTIPEWCRQNGDFTNSVLDELKAYFVKSTHFKSFISIPLLTAWQIIGEAPPQEADSRLIGVLNIHSSEPNLLRGAESWFREKDSSTIQFVSITQPMILMLVKLLLGTTFPTTSPQQGIDPEKPAE